jgi:DNA-binding XRE family transcriptional regulator
MKPQCIVKLRKVLGFTQEQLAKEIGAFGETVARWELGIHQPRGATSRETNPGQNETGKRCGDKEEKSML